MVELSNNVVPTFVTLKNGPGFANDEEYTKNSMKIRVFSNVIAHLEKN